ncbi:hypothetical protein AGMMS50222_06480 [Endomicrobiia bacterium]|nr:hypothetical protein AGMMS49531_07400 [Endomicrobiia bacterium]GHT66033.1 hypothetical protein AGMMS49556_06580 [Endomicrobiia bacterium]GHT70362.1 hypothetical protein AGMMS49950_05210 [Endomicrobiia bacterium]GHT75468.1 hypothetical protein AGMMS50222_06480 [Endomicrobiia bacterium]
MKKFNFMFVIMFTAVCYADDIADDIIVGETVIISDEMEIKKTEEVTNYTGNSKAINNCNEIIADKMTYYKKKSDLLAEGKVKLSLKNKKGEPIEASGNLAKYNTASQTGEIYGDSALIRYFIEGSTVPYTLHAKKINIDRKNQTLRAYDDVEVITSSGTIHSDNGVFDKNNTSIVFKKDKKRPTVNVNHDGGKGRYEADEMIFYNKDNRIVMKGSIIGKIKMEKDIK